jgi:protein SCO1/2
VRRRLLGAAGALLIFSARVAAAPEAARTTPRYLLQGPRGAAVTSADFRGRYQLIAFGFVSCPDVCPTTLVEMQQVLAALGARAARVQPIFITVDPQRDTRTVLDAYTRAFDDRIIGLTGSDALVRAAADAFKVRFEIVREPGATANAYTVDHSAGMFLLGPDGQLLARLAYGTPVAQLVARIEEWLRAGG